MSRPFATNVPALRDSKPDLSDVNSPDLGDVESHERSNYEQAYNEPTR